MPTTTTTKGTGARVHYTHSGVRNELAHQVDGRPRIVDARIISTPPGGYTVQEGDCDSDGLGISANSLRLNGGAIRDPAGNASGLSHETVIADPGQRVAACHRS